MLFKKRERQLWERTGLCTEPLSNWYSSPEGNRNPAPHTEKLDHLGLQVLHLSPAGPSAPHPTPTACIQLRGFFAFLIYGGIKVTPELAGVYRQGSLLEQGRGHRPCLEAGKAVACAPGTQQLRAAAVSRAVGWKLLTCHTLGKAGEGPSSHTRNASAETKQVWAVTHCSSPIWWILKLQTRKRKHSWGRGTERGKF